MMSSGTSITARRALRYRPIDPATTFDVPPWQHVSRQLPEKHFSSSLLSATKHWLLRSPDSSISLATLVGVGMCLMVLILVLTQTMIGWTETTFDTWRYGMPRTFQTDAYVGHEQNSHQASHFIACNNRGRVEVIEFPGNDATRARIFFGPQLSGNNADLIPVTLQFIGTNSSHYPDMIVHVGNDTVRFQNNHDTFLLT